MTRLAILFILAALVVGIVGLIAGCSARKDFPRDSAGHAYAVPSDMPMCGARITEPCVLVK